MVCLTIHFAEYLPQRQEQTEIKEPHEYYSPKFTKVFINPLKLQLNHHYLVE